MQKRKPKSSKYISKKKSTEKYPSELIEQVYKMTYAMLKCKYKDNKIQDCEIEEKAIDRAVQLLMSNDLHNVIKTKSKIDFEFYLYKEISNKLNVVLTN